MKRWIVNQFEISRGSGISAMEGMRGLAAFLVFTVHYVTQSEPWTGEWMRSFATALMPVGSIGVDLFFVLSGYLIYGTLISNNHSFGAFISRRAKRIYPTFLVVLGLYLVLSFVFPSQSKLPDENMFAYLLQNILLLPGIFPIEPIIVVAWSLSYEMFFYVTIPLLVAVFLLKRWPPSQRFAAFSLIAIALTVCDLDQKRAVMFVGGMLVYEAIKLFRVPPAWAGLAGLALALSSPSLPVHSYVRLAILLVSCSVLCWHCFVGRSWLTAAFSWAPIRWLGNMSYSYYLIHGLTLKVAFIVLAWLIPAGKDLFWPLLVPMFAVTLIPSALLFIVIERPFSLAKRSVRAPLGAKPVQS